jgi:hypothetical protein
MKKKIVVTEKKQKKEERKKEKTVPEPNGPRPSLPDLVAGVYGAPH